MDRCFVVALASVAAAACTDAPTALTAGRAMEFVLSGMRPLDPAREGTLELWIATASGDTASAGRIALPEMPEGGEARFSFTLPVDQPSGAKVTLEPPGDADDRPSAYTLLAGSFQGSAATLRLEGAVTVGPPLEDAPGAHSLFTTSNNAALGYPSFENAGVWMFSTLPQRNEHGTRELHVTPLRPAWVYEGWIVLRYGTPDAVWISYGKFRPDQYQLLSSRDNTGSGPFSSDEDFRNGGVEDVPGDEWTTPREGMALPGGLTLPLELDAVDPVTGEALWTHVITIEPAFDEDEPLLSERPFPIQPYWNPIGAGAPHMPRVIRFREDLPAGVVRTAQ